MIYNSYKYIAKNRIYDPLKYIGGNIYKRGLNLFPPCRDKLVQWLKSPAISGVLVDRVGSSGSEVGREDVVNRYLEGDGTRYVELNSGISLGNSHTIELELKRTSTLGCIIIGQTDNTSECLIANRVVVGELTYRGDDSVNHDLDTDGALNDGNNHTYKIIRTETLVELYIDGDLKDSSNVDSSTTFTISSLFNYLGNIPFIGICSYIDLNGTMFDFTTGNQDTTVTGTNLATGEFITGSIQAATGSDRLTSTNIGQSAMNDYGYVLSDGTTFYYDQTLTQLIPSGKYIQVAQNGVCSCFITDGVQPLARDVGGFVGGLKANVQYCDSDGTPNPMGTHIIELTTRTAEADYLTTLQHFNHDDLDARYPIPVAVADAEPNDGDIRFSRFDESNSLLEQALYSEALTDECLAKANDFFNIKTNETTDADDKILLDANGDNIVLSLI